MSEPITASIGSFNPVLLAVALMGPVAGPYVTVIASAMAGSLWPLSAATTGTRREGGWLVVRVTTLAVCLTYPICEYLSRAYGVAPDYSMTLVALAIGIMGNGWRPIFAAFSQGLANRASNFTDTKSESSGAEK